MGRRATLLPSHLVSGHWCVSVPPHLSETGKRYRRYFETKATALGFCEELKCRRDNLESSVMTLTASQTLDAASAFQLLGDGTETLVEIVRAHLNLQKQKTASVTFLELFNQFLETKRDRHPEYLKELNRVKKKYVELHDKLACDITSNELEELLAPLSGGARNPIMRYLRAVFFFGIKRGFLRENPVLRMDFADRKRTEIKIIENGKVRAMLNHAIENDLNLLPYLVLGFFAGIRAEGELPEIEWRDVDLADCVVTVRPEVSKTNRRRFVDLSDNSIAWLKAYGERGGTFAGRVVSYNPSELRAHRTANWKAAGVSKWVQSGMRHTFCSAWLNLHRDINKLTLMSGHDSVDTMWRNYFKGMAAAEAKGFWEILPPTTDSEKIVYLTR